MTEEHLADIVRIGGRKVRIHYERGRQGLWYATSPDVSGLFVATAALDDCQLEAWRVAQRLVLGSFTMVSP